MKTKKFFVGIMIIIVLIISAFLLIKQKNKSEQEVLTSTYDISREYLSLRHRTDNILLQAKEYSDYASWDQDMSALIEDWATLEQESQKLESAADKEADKVSMKPISMPTVKAYTAKEITDIFDKAPKFKGIATLAKHLGVDAKRAQLILNQAQDGMSVEVFSEEGDAFENLENSAIVIKDGCKVTGFVGGVILTGGAAGFAAAGTMTQIGTVVVGVDLALEVTEDGAQVAFGDKNKVSSFVKDVRKVTEPVASVIAITNVPSNLGTAFGKVDSVMLGLEKFRQTAQEGKVLGIDLKNFEYHPPFQVIKQAKYPGAVTVAEMEMAEVEEWLNSLNVKLEPMTQEEVKEFLESPAKEAKEDKKDADKQDANKKDEDKATSQKADESESSTNKGRMSVSEYEELDDKDLLKSIALVEKHLGKPDINTTNDKGNIVYVYYDLLRNEDGDLVSVKISFYNEENYRSFINSMGLSWESNKETWDESGGGLTAITLMRSAETFKQEYGE